MNQFFNVYLYDVTNNETIWFSKPDGSVTDVVILDDGWAPNVTKYVRDGEKTWSDVVEELECMTNVATRDEALALIEKLNALVHRAARDIEEKQAYTVRFVVKSQFSTAQNEAFTHVVSPPDDGNVITLSTDIQTAPPGQIRFKLSFKRTGAWITSSSDITHQGILTTYLNPSSGFWRLQTTLPTNITIPTPISLSFSFTDSINEIWFDKLYFCINVEEVYKNNSFMWEEPFNMSYYSFPYWMYAVGGYSINDNTDSYIFDKRPVAFATIPEGTYAVFVSWVAPQPNVAHSLQIQFDNGAETRNMLLIAPDSRTRYEYFGTVNMKTKPYYVYLRTKIGHSTGFLLEKIVFVKLKKNSNIVLLSNKRFFRGVTLNIENSVLKPYNLFSAVLHYDGYSLNHVLNVYDSLDVITDNQLLTIVLVGNSRDVFSLRNINSNGDPINSIPVTISYRDIRTTFH